MIMNHLKSQGLFDQFRSDCLADVDTKPAYQNLRQRVDNFVANHLATHTWSPHLNKTQLRNSIRQQVLKSGMLESGIDRIISQVVDPKINHTFRPQVEKAVHEFLATLNHKEEAAGNTAPDDEKPDSSLITQGVPAPGPSANVASDAMSILETITSLNQEANALELQQKCQMPRPMRECPENSHLSLALTSALTRREALRMELIEKRLPLILEPRGWKPLPSQKNLVISLVQWKKLKITRKRIAYFNQVRMLSRKVVTKKINQWTKQKRNQTVMRKEKERKKEKKEKTDKKIDHSKRSEDTQKAKDEKQSKDREVESMKPSEKINSRARTVEGTKEDCSLMDSDVDGLTDITVSSVHTSDLSSFEEDTEGKLSCLIAWKKERLHPMMKRKTSRIKQKLKPLTLVMGRPEVYGMLTFTNLTFTQSTTAILMMSSQ
ncbi:Biorientation of chromosomes in cell division protein 1-like 1 [Lemmus lemmus]